MTEFKPECQITEPECQILYHLRENEAFSRGHSLWATHIFNLRPLGRVFLPIFK